MQHLTTYTADRRTSTRELLQAIYAALGAGETEFTIDASGQHDIGGPLWNADRRPIRLVVRNPGQRVGAMGLAGTEVIVEGPAPADVGWLNAGATIVVKGDGGDTSGHCAADGVIYIGGRAGARSGSLMKHDPADPPPQLWILKNTGSFPFEFMGGGLAVVCGYDCEGVDSVLGDRACIGMVGGTVYVRGPVKGLPRNVKLVQPLAGEDWAFLRQGLPRFLEAVGRRELLESLLDPQAWAKVVARSDLELNARPLREPLRAFHAGRWIAGGLFGDVVSDRGEIVPLVPTGNYRAWSPVWNNAVFAAPCEYACPSDIPTQDRINLLRKGKIREALDLVLNYSPFPGSVCGAACPNPCMTACTRQTIDFAVLAGPLGRLSMDLPAPRPAPSTDQEFAVIGSGAGGLSAAWQLALRGHQVTLFERSHTLGGKMAHVIPNDRLQKDIVQTEIRRILSVGVDVRYGVEVTREKFEALRDRYDGLIIASGAYQPRPLAFPGSETTCSALGFLTSANNRQPAVSVDGLSVVVIGAGDVGMDVCAVAWKLGASSVTAIDIQEPASASREREAALALGTQVVWPRAVRAYAYHRLIFEAGEPLPADVVIVSIGEVPDTSWLPENLRRVQGRWLEVDEVGRTSDPKVFAIGDVVKPGLLTGAIGQGRIAALALHAQVSGETFDLPRKKAIPAERLNLTYFAPRLHQCPTDPLAEADRCISCGTCRDCNICVTLCGQNAISRVEHPHGAFEFRVSEDNCVGCGFCAAACPSGIWTMVPNLVDDKEKE